MEHTLFGKHLIINASAKAFPLASRLYGILMHLPNHLAMQRLGQPSVFVTPKSCMGLVVIAESHISVHMISDSDRVLAWIDVFSCKDFNASKVINYFTSELELSQVSSKVLIRCQEQQGDRLQCQEAGATHQNSEPQLERIL